MHMYTEMYRHTVLLYFMLAVIVSITGCANLNLVA